MNIPIILSQQPLLREGKTKRIYGASNPEKVFVLSKDDITAGDGAQHDIIEGKGALANSTTCNVFEFLNACGVDVAFDKRIEPNLFMAPKCDMLPYEVVVRGAAYGSYLKRNPRVEKGHIFPQPIAEMFLKTNNKKWKGQELVCDDPLMALDMEGGVLLFDPKVPDTEEEPAQPFLILPENEVFTTAFEEYWICEMMAIARHVFVLLRHAWMHHTKGNLVDFKVEFGLDLYNRLRLADVIDNDSWRVLNAEGEDISKEHYRQGGTLEEVAERYRLVERITSHFTAIR